MKDKPPEVVEGSEVNPTCQAHPVDCHHLYLEFLTPRVCSKGLPVNPASCMALLGIRPSSRELTPWGRAR